jgi:hypothetical protein
MSRLETDRAAALEASKASQARAKRENAKHTPGPWKALGLLMGFGYVFKYYNADGVESIAYIQAYDIDDDTPEPYGKWSDVSKANHDLVLAAPELLDALTGLLAVVNVRIDDPRTQQFDKARAAIARATGEPQ